MYHFHYAKYYHKLSEGKHTVATMRMFHYSKFRTLCIRYKVGFGARLTLDERDVSKDPEESPDRSMVLFPTIL